MRTWAREFEPSFDKAISRRGKKEYYKAFIALDTETSWNHDEENPIGWIYQWAFRVEEERVLGRTPSELVNCLRKIESYLDEGEAKVLVFVHNLSYDITYLQDFLIREYKDYKLLALKPHKFITFSVGRFEFRCTWKLSNRSLDKWAKDLGTASQKLVGTVDYQEIHYQDEELPAHWWEYQLGDIDTLWECVNAQLALYKDSLATLPLTSTGYVRRTARKHFRKDPKNRKRFLNTKMDAHVYSLLLKEFAGAISHGNRYRVEETIEGTIKHRDFVSHYPSQQRVREFPIGKFILYETHATLEDVEKAREDSCCLISCIFKNIIIKNSDITMPFLSESKCLAGRVGKVHTISDNGRVLKLDGIVELVFTEIDLDCFLSQYDFEDYDIPELYVSTRGKLPQFLIDTIDEFMLGKTKFKMLERAEEDEEKKRDFHMSLMKSKNGLNGIYGMTAQRPIQPEITMDEDGNFPPPTPWTEEEIEELLSKFYGNRNSFNRFAFGCWCTSWARKELLDFCELIGWNSVLYCDTDSAFYLSTPDIEERIEKRNEELRLEAMAKGAYIEYEGKVVNYDKFDLEDEEIVSFRFLHSKCYAYEEMVNGERKLRLTIAGVPARESDITKFTREMELGSIDNLAPGFVFTRCGGTKAVYVNAKPFLYEHEGHIIECASSCIITNTTKTLKSFLEKGDELIEWEVIE